MNRNVESHFSQLPQTNIERSIFDRSFTHKTSWNIGSVIPFFIDEVLPSDTFNVTTSFVARLQTMLTPIMDNIYLDTYYFFVPCRLLWNHWKEFMGENTESAWIPETTYTVPQIASPEGGWNVGTLADYLGIPTGVPFDVDDLTVSALPFRAVALCMQEWFRDQNLSDPLNIPLGDATQSGSNGTNYITDVVNGGMPFVAAKYHDYFTSCLPSPQKGPPVTFGANPIATISGLLPVDTGAESHTRDEPYQALWQVYGSYSSDTGKYSNKLTNLTGNHLMETQFTAGVGNTKALTATQSGDNNYITPVNLWADASAANLSVSGVSFTINELRLAFQLQKFYEKSARSGTRYREVLKSHFGCTSPDSRMMIPEYLGGHRVPIQIHQITNTSDVDGANLGDLGAMSNTADVHEDFVKSFTEHGYVIGFAVCRYDHSYPQGLERSWTRKTYLDYYWPVFANIGEQPVYKYEIDATKRVGEDRKSVFGYNEAYSDYRYKPNRVSAEMRPGISNSLASWHLADYYATMPTLSDSWVREDKTNVDRTLAVTSAVSHQIFADFYVKNTVVRPMPMYSIPGLIDHH